MAGCSSHAERVCPPRTTSRQSLKFSTRSQLWRPTRRAAISFVSSRPFVNQAPSTATHSSQPEPRQKRRRRAARQRSRALRRTLAPRMEPRGVCLRACKMSRPTLLLCAQGNTRPATREHRQPNICQPHLIEHELGWAAGTDAQDHLQFRSIPVTDNGTKPQPSAGRTGWSGSRLKNSRVDT